MKCPKCNKLMIQTPKKYEHEYICTICNIHVTEII